jgi:hypothetical protein
MHRYSGSLLAAVLILSFSGSADAQQYMSFGFGAPSSRQSPAVNLYLSALYDRLLQTSPRFRAYRMWKECHTINISPLRGDCIASFDQYEPVLYR